MTGDDLLQWLTRPQLDAFQLRGQGLTHRQIADKLHVTPAAITQRLEAADRKLSRLSSNTHKYVNPLRST